MIGCCVVTCAGNEGNARLHYKGSVLNKEYEDVELRVGEGTNGFTMELWGNSPDIISVAFISPSGEMISRIPARVGQSDTVEFLLEKSKIDISYSLVEAGGGVELIFMRFIDPTPGVWIIRVYGNNILEGDYNIWLPIKQFIDKETYFLKPNPDITLTVPSTTQATITVAAYDNMTNALFTDSSRGFTRTNEIKPDITAPGVNVYGPGINNNYVRKSGTSVAAALVAGNCAQLMQWGIVEKNETQMKTNYIKNFLIRGYNIAYIVHCLKFKRFRAAVGMALLAAHAGYRRVEIPFRHRLGRGQHGQPGAEPHHGQPRAPRRCCGGDGRAVARRCDGGLYRRLHGALLGGDVGAQHLVPRQRQARGLRILWLDLLGRPRSERRDPRRTFEIRRSAARAGGRDDGIFPVFPRRRADRLGYQ